jgi:hypothetical protein
MENKKDSEETVIISGDAKLSKEEEAALSNPVGGMEITSVEQLMELAKAARETKGVFDEHIKLKMTKERAERIKTLRLAEGLSWRAVASSVFVEWGEDAAWFPESNQLAGMSLCEEAQRILGESEGWN